MTRDMIRFLELAIFEVERNWAYAMQLKFEAGEDKFSRKRFHLRQKLRKAVKHSENLEQIARQSPRVSIFLSYKSPRRR